MGLWGPLREEGDSPLGLGAKGGAHSSLGRRTPPLGGLVPHGGGEEDDTPPWPI